MSDKLKSFIDEHRKEFDSSDPAPHLLKKLQERLSGNIVRIKKKWNVLQWAAAITLPLLLATVLFVVFQKKNPPDERIVNQPMAEDVTDLGYPVYAKQIYQFKEMIGLQQNELKQLQLLYPKLYNQFKGDINELDSSYQSLKTKLAETPNREMLLEAMIQNLQLQSDLLNRQLLIIKEIKQKNKQHEKNII